MPEPADQHRSPVAKALGFGVIVLAVIAGTVTAVVFLWSSVFGDHAPAAAPTSPPVAAPAPPPDPDAIFARRLAAARTPDELWELGETLFDWQRGEDVNREDLTPGELRAWLQEDWEYHGWGDNPGAEVLHDLRRLGYR